MQETGDNQFNWAPKLGYLREQEPIEQTIKAPLKLQAKVMLLYDGAAATFKLWGSDYIQHIAGQCKCWSKAKATAATLEKNCFVSAGLLCLLFVVGLFVFLILIYKRLTHLITRSCRHREMSVNDGNPSLPAHRKRHWLKGIFLELFPLHYSQLKSK